MSSMDVEDDAKVAGGGTTQLYKARFGTKEICGRSCKIPSEFPPRPYNGPPTSRHVLSRSPDRNPPDDLSLLPHPSSQNHQAALQAGAIQSRLDDAISGQERRRHQSDGSETPSKSSVARLASPVIHRSSECVTGVLTLELPLLRLSKTIHIEAASVLYGENEFQFVLAITRRHPQVRAPKFHQPPYHDFRDNLTVVSEGYLKMIKTCTVEIRLPTFPWTWAKEMYLQYYARLAAFATCFGGDDHSLQKVTILFNRCFRTGYYFPLSCLRTSENVLETLAAIHGVRISVTVGGVTPAFEAKLSLAMMSKVIAYGHKEEEYRERMVILKGKRRLQRYKLGRYYDLKVVWSRNVFGPYPPHSKKAPPAFECCEVCDGKPPLKFPYFWRPP